jgi:arsenite-transporting ATPase
LYRVFTKEIIHEIPWYDTDLKGLEAVDRINREILVQEDILKIKKTRSGETYEKTDRGYMLRLYLPIAERDRQMENLF